jgi:cyclopropane fatty-acyl-phospholipid synthase-like methyltransferase
VFAEAGVARQVTAVRAEAHTLPFGKDSFDAIVSIDAFEYFGTADGYLPSSCGSCDLAGSWAWRHQRWPARCASYA